MTKVILKGKRRYRLADGKSCLERLGKKGHQSRILEAQEMACQAEADETSGLRIRSTSFHWLLQVLARESHLSEPPLAKGDQA